MSSTRLFVVSDCDVTLGEADKFLIDLGDLLLYKFYIVMAYVVIADKFLIDLGERGGTVRWCSTAVLGAAAGVLAHRRGSSRRLELTMAVLGVQYEGAALLGAQLGARGTIRELLSWANHARDTVLAALRRSYGMGPQRSTKDTVPRTQCQGHSAEDTVPRTQCRGHSAEDTVPRTQ